MKQRNGYMILGIAMALAVSAGCGRIERYGAPLTGEPVTKIAEIMKNPGDYTGRTVKVEGKIVNECPTGCWFNVTDETGTLFIDLLGANLAIPQKVGKHVTLEGTIKERAGLPIIHGTGVVIR
ncbi:MAG TPA: hypothetical protein PKV41_00590 [Candidatus Omnitrophota bacterium]|nr:hypothetical protein [Candidatus Omnitrophota bacterium]